MDFGLTVVIIVLTPIGVVFAAAAAWAIKDIIYGS